MLKLEHIEMLEMILLALCWEEGAVCMNESKPQSRETVLGFCETSNISERYIHSVMYGLVFDGLVYADYAGSRFVPEYDVMLSPTRRGIERLVELENKVSKVCSTFEMIKDNI